MEIYLVFAMHPDIPAAGGVRPYVLGLAKMMNQRGHRVHIIGAGPETKLDYGEFLSVTPKCPLSEYEYLLALSSWLRHHEPVQGAVVHCQRPDELYAFARRFPRTGLVCTLHGDPSRGVAQRRILGRLLYQYAEKHALAASRQVISVSEVGLQVYLRRYPGLRDKATVIPVGIDLKVFRPGDRLGSKRALGLDGRPTLLFAGRLEPEKRVEVLLDYAERLGGGVQVLIAGEGRLGDKLEKRYAADHVRFLGPVSPERMQTLYSAANALILPSAYEGIPTVMLESLACGTPVIATPVGDVARIIIEGLNGYLFDGTSVALTHLMRTHLSDLDAMRDACIASGRRYGWESIADRVLEVYRRAS